MLHAPFNQSEHHPHAKDFLLSVSPPSQQRYDLTVIPCLKNSAVCPDYQEKNQGDGSGIPRQHVLPCW